MSGIVAQNINKQSGLIKAPEGGTGAWTFISKSTASSSDDISITSGLDDTYVQYLITCKDVHCSGDDSSFQWNGSIDAGSNYNVSKTMVAWKARHNEADSVASFVELQSLSNDAGFMHCVEGCGSDNDQAQAGYIHLFNPSSTTFVKHFLYDFSGYRHADTAVHILGGGYFNTTSDIDAVQFKMTSGTIDVGDFCLYGLTKWVEL